MKSETSLATRLRILAGEGHVLPVAGNFLLELARHPRLMGREIGNFLADAAGFAKKPSPGIWFEQHSHSHFSDGAGLSAIVEHLFDHKEAWMPLEPCATDRYLLWSLTDHNHPHNSPEAFDNLVSGAYKLESKADRRYDVQVNDDRRFLFISAGDKHLVLLRSLEYLTDRGEIGFHGFQGDFPKNRMPLEKAIRWGLDHGAYAIINHPYFWDGVGWKGRDAVERAVVAGACAIEKNGTEIPPMIYDPVRAELEAKRLGVQLVTSGDAHLLRMYLRSGLLFEPETYRAQLDECGGNHADAIHSLVTSGRFGTRLAYLDPVTFIRFWLTGLGKDFKGTYEEQEKQVVVAGG